jgi:hypothetical protein
MARSTNVSISSKISATDAHHDTITQFGFWDKTSDLVSGHPSGYFTVSGTQAANSDFVTRRESEICSGLARGFKRLALRFKEAIRRSSAF